MGESFIVSIKPALEEMDEWSKEVETAWFELFKFMSHHMKADYPQDPENDENNDCTADSNFSKLKARLSLKKSH